MSKTYERIAEELARRIGSGDYGLSTPIPSERALEVEFSAHRATIRRALQRLAEQGLLTRSPGQRAYTKSPEATVVNVGVFAGGVNDPYFRSMVLEGVKETIDQNHPSFTAFSAAATHFSSFMDPPHEKRRDSIKHPLSGLILLPPHSPDLPAIRSLKAKIPITLLDRMIPGFESDFVGFQDFEGGFAAACHLYEVGHRRIAFLGSVVPETADQRCLGVQAFCREAGLEQSWNFLAYAGGGEVPEAYVKAIVAQARETWPTAAVCANDETAAFMISSLGRLGLRVPADIAVIGFGNAQTGMLDALGLSTMAQPYKDVGHEALTMIADRLGGRATGRAMEVRLPMKLVVRSSCGATSPVEAA